MCNAGGENSEAVVLVSSLLAEQSLLTLRPVDQADTAATSTTKLEKLDIQKYIVLLKHLPLYSFYKQIQYEHLASVFIALSISDTLLLVDAC